MRLERTARNVLLGALAFTLVPTAAVASTAADPTYQGHDDGGFDWELLGLLGLAGLLGLKHNDDNHRNTRSE